MGFVVAQVVGVLAAPAGVLFHHGVAGDLVGLHEAAMGSYSGSPAALSLASKLIIVMTVSLGIG